MPLNRITADSITDGTVIASDIEFAYQERLAKHYQYAYDRCK